MGEAQFLLCEKLLKKNRQLKEEVEGHWPECCDGLALLCNDWKPEGE